MTISSTTRKTGALAGNGSQTAFTFTFKVQDSDDIAVYQLAADVETTVSPTVYTVTLNTDQNANPGGTVEFDTAPATGVTVRITTEADSTQETSVQNQGAFNPTVLVEAFDKLTISVQQIEERLSRVPTFPIMTPPTDATLPDAAARADKVIGFDADGDLAVLQAAALAGAQAVVAASWTNRLTAAVSKTIPFIRPEWYNALDTVTDPGTDHTANFLAAASAAAAEGRILDLGGKTYAVEGVVYDGLDNLVTRNGGLVKRTPTAGQFCLSAEDTPGLVFERVKFDRGTDGTIGSLNVDAGIYLLGCDRAVLTGCEVTGDGKGSGILMQYSDDVLIDRLYAHDIFYTHVAETDDSVHGLWLRYCNRFVIDRSVFRIIGRDDQTSASRDRYSRLIALSGCRTGLIHASSFYRGDQHIDVTGSDGNMNVTVANCLGMFPHSVMVKFSGSARSCKAIGNQAIGAGLYAFLANGAGGNHLNATRDIDFIGNKALNTGCAKKQTASNIKGFSAERSTGSSSPFSSTPKNVKFLACEAVSEIGSAATTVASTTLMAIDSATLLMEFSPGVRAQFTASAYPTGLAAATDYWLLPITGTSNYAVCNSFDNFLRAYEAVEAGTSYAAYVISTLAGGTSVVVTLQQDMYDGFFNNVATADIDTATPNIARGCSSVGHTNKAYNGLHVPIVTVAAGATQSIPDATFTDLVLATTTVVDSMGLYNTGTGEFTVPYSGFWALDVEPEFAANATGVRRAKVLADTGGGYAAVTPVYNYANQGASFEVLCHMNHKGWYARGTKLKVQVSQNSTAALNITANSRVKFYPASDLGGTI